MPPKSDIQICPAIIVIIAGTNTLSPACQRHTRFSGCVSERSIAIVVIEMAGRFLPFGKTLQRRAVNEKDVRPSIIVIVNERRSASRCSFRTRLCIASAGVWLTLDAGKFEDIEVNSRTGAMRAGFSPATEFLRAARLRIEQPSKNSGAASYQPAKLLKQERGAHVIPIGQGTTWVDLTANQ